MIAVLQQLRLLSRLFAMHMAKICLIEYKGSGQPWRRGGGRERPGCKRLCYGSNAKMACVLIRDEDVESNLGMIANVAITRTM